MARRKNKIPLEQGQLPLDLPILERYDPHDGKGNDSTSNDRQLSFLESDRIIRDSGSQKWKLEGKKKDEKPISVSINSTNDHNPFVDQFCEQVARIIAKGKTTGKVKTGGKHESSSLRKGEQ